MPVCMQHRQNATWEPATVVNQCAPNSYWIMQENGAGQPRIYRHTRTSLQIRSTPTDGEAKAQMEEYFPEKDTLDLPESEFFSKNREESQLAEPLCTGGTTLENAPDTPNAPVHCKSTRENFGKPAKKYSDQLYL